MTIDYDLLNNESTCICSVDNFFLLLVVLCVCSNIYMYFFSLVVLQLLPLEDVLRLLHVSSQSKLYNKLVS